MKKLLILFSVTNIFLGLLLLAIEAGKPTTPLSVEMTATYSIITLFLLPAQACYSKEICLDIESPFGYVDGFRRAVGNHQLLYLARSP